MNRRPEYLCFITNVVMKVNPVGQPQQSAGLTGHILRMLTDFCTHKEITQLLG